MPGHSPVAFAAVTRAQADAIADDSHLLLFCGAWGSAKTEALLRKTIVLAQQFPGIRCRLLRQLAQDARAILLPRFLEMLPAGWLVDVNKSDALVTLRPSHGRTTLVQFGGMKPAETGQDRWAGTEFGFTGIDEATQVVDANLFQKSVMRSARQPGIGFSQIMMVCNADSPGHWLYRWFYEGQHPQAAGLRYRLIEGPTIPQVAGILPPHYYAMLAGLTGVLRQRYIENRWVAHEGLVYPYDPRVQLLRPTGAGYADSTGREVVTAQQLASWRLVLSVDFGFDHPFVAQFWRVSPSDSWYLQREVYMTRRTVRTHSRQILDVYAALGGGGSPLAVCDHDAEDAATLRENGIQTRPAYKARLAGQQRVYDLFPHPDESDPDGEAVTPCRVYFLDDALVETDQDRRLAGLPTRTVDEFGSYVWQSGCREDMCKAKDDGMDAMRYAMVERYAPRVGLHILGG